MRTIGRRLAIGWLVAVVTVVTVPSVVAAASPCAPGQPPGRPPGRPPNQPGQPPGRPPQYPPGQCQLQLSRSAGVAGSAVTASGSGYAPASTVRLSLDDHALGSASTDAGGAFTASVTIPTGTAPGAYDIQAVGPDAVDGTRVLSAAFTVVGDDGAEPSGRASGQVGGSGSLPRTGSSSSVPLLLVAIGLIALGTGGSLAARRRGTSRDG